MRAINPPARPASDLRPANGSRQTKQNLTATKPNWRERENVLKRLLGYS